MSFHKQPFFPLQELESAWDIEPLTMRDEAPKIAANDAMPGSPESRVKFLLDCLRYILFYGVLVHGFSCHINRLLLHLFGLCHIVDQRSSCYALGREGGGKPALAEPSMHWEGGTNHVCRLDLR